MNKENYTWKDKKKKNIYNLNLSYTSKDEFDKLMNSIKLSRNYHNARIMFRFTYTLGSICGAWVICNSTSQNEIIDVIKDVAMIGFVLGNAFLSGECGGKELLTNEEIVEQIETSSTIKYEKKPYGLNLYNK